MADKIDTRAVGLDVGLAFIRWLTGAENLHYGLWTGLEVTAGNLRRGAGRLYGQAVRLPAATGRCAFWTSAAARARRRRSCWRWGIRSRSWCRRPFWRRAAGRTRRVPWCMNALFEDFAGQGPFDLCLFSESFQYIPLADSLPKCAALLAPGRQVLIADCFRTEAYQGRGTHGPQPGGGHRLSAFRAALDGSAFVVAAEEDITDAVAPSIDLEQRLFNVLGHGVTRVSDEIAGQEAAAHWTLAAAHRAVPVGKRRAQPDAAPDRHQPQCRGVPRFQPLSDPAVGHG